MDFYDQNWRYLRGIRTRITMQIGRYCDIVKCVRGFIWANRQNLKSVYSWTVWEAHSQL